MKVKKRIQLADKLSKELHNIASTERLDKTKYDTMESKIMLNQTQQIELFHKARSRQRIPTNKEYEFDYSTIQASNLSSIRT